MSLVQKKLLKGRFTLKQNQCPVKTTPLKSTHWRQSRLGRLLTNILTREQNPSCLLWERHALPGTDGIIHVVGHHPTRGEPYFESGRYNLDTGAVYGQKLTACDVLTGQFWQVGWLR